MSCHFFYRYSMLLFLFIPFFLKGQINIKVGYIGGFTRAPELNKVINNFNEKFVSKYNGKLGDALDDVRSLHGLEVGLRYRMNKVGMELSWHNMSDKSDVFGTLSSGVNFQDKWFTSLTEYSFGLENYIGNFGYGAAIGYRTTRIKTDIVGAPRKKQTVTSESGFASKFYLLFQYPGDKVGIAFKPYVQVPLKNIDISNFDHEINLQLDESYITAMPLEERFFMYGISIVLYNGKQ
jgi:hypothetical protein